MKETLDVALLQCPLHWLEVKQNLDLLTDAASQTQPGDLLICPEMTTTGFCIDVNKISETAADDLLNHLTYLAKKHEIAIVAGTAVKEQGKWYNRALFVFPDGEHQHYDKRHLFSYADEDKSFSPGQRPTIVSYRGWRLNLQICYDLRFPVFSRNQNNAYDVLLYIANWPERRIHAWNALLPARAIENQAYVIGVNRTGKDPYAHYNGQSIALHPSGTPLLQLNEEEHTVKRTSLSASALETFRARFPFLHDADTFTLE